MTDLVSLVKFLDQGISSIALVVLLIYALVALYKRLMETQEARVKDSIERESTVTIALESVTDTMKSILITLDKQNGKNESKD
jgi:hypothetical protein